MTHARRLPSAFGTAREVSSERLEPKSQRKCALTMPTGNALTRDELRSRRNSASSRRNRELVAFAIGGYWRYRHHGKPGLTALLAFQP